MPISGVCVELQNFKLANLISFFFIDYSDPVCDPEYFFFIYLFMSPNTDNYLVYHNRLLRLIILGFTMCSF